MATDLERLVVQLSADIKGYENAMNRASGIMNRQAREIERRSSQMAKRLDGIGRTAAEGLIAPLSSIAAALSVREIAAYADAWTLAGNKIRAAATASGVQVRSLNDIKDGANAARADLESYVDLYAKLIRNASGVAESEQQIATATEVVAKAFKVGGASANEQAAGILQLGQALGSGVLQGDELRSLRENAPVIAKAIADAMGVSIGQLKDLGAEGKITSDIVFGALLAAQADVEAQFRATNATISDGITALNNEFTAYIGNADTSAGASRGLANALLDLAANFGTVADATLTFATVVVGALTGRALAGMVTSLGNAVVAVGALLTALRAGVPVAATFTAALGPIGLLAGAAAAALVVLSLRQEQADETAQAHRKALIELKDAFAQAQGGSDAAKKKFADLSAQHLKAAEAAVSNAQAQLEAARAVQAAGESMRFVDALAGASQAGFVDQNVEAAAARLDALKKDLADLLKRLANPTEGLKSDTAGYGNAPATPTSDPKVGRRTASDRFREDVQAVRDRTAALAEEQAMIGQGMAAQESRRLALQLEQQALADLREESRRKGEADLASIQLAPEQIAAIREVADAYGQQVESLYRAQEAFGQLNDTARDAVGGFVSDIMDGVDAADALANALDRVIDRLLDSALDGIFSPAGGNILGSLFKGVGFASGGYTGAGGKYQPAGVVHKGEYVFDQQSVRAAGGPAVLDAMRAGLKGYASGGAVAAPRLPSLQSLRAASGSGSPIVNVSVETLPGTTADVVQTRRSDGSTDIRAIVRQVADAMANDVKGRGVLGRAMESRYGLNPARGQGR